MICDGRGCSVIAHLNCYFSAGSQDANDAITDIEHWHCENCGGLPRHMHPRPQATKRARVSFDPVLPTPMAATSAQAVSTTHPSGGWGGHWPIRTAMPPPAKGKGKEAMETLRNDSSICDMQPPANKRHAGPRPDQDESNFLMSLPSAACTMPIEPPTRRVRGPKRKTALTQNPSGHGHKKHHEYKGRKQSGKPP